MRIAHEGDPQSYGTLSHLCASVAHESARSKPRTRCARAASRGPEAERAVDVHPRAGLAARARDLATGSNAPVFTLPACMQTIVGPRDRRQLAATHASLRVDGHRSTRAAQAEKAQRLEQATCTSSPTTTVIGGARTNRRALDIPAGALRRRARRREPAKFAIVAPVTKPTRP